jgi:hypothetical protein
LLLSKKQTLLAAVLLLLSTALTAGVNLLLCCEGAVLE